MTGEKRVRVLHVIDNLLLGGTEKQCFTIVKGLNKERFDVRVIALNKDGPLFGAYLEQGIPIEEIRIGGGFYRPRSILQTLRLSFWMRREEIAIVQTYGFYSTIPAVIAARLAGVPVIIAGKRDLSEFITRGQFLLEKMLWRLCDRIVVNAKGLKANLTAREGVPPERIDVIYNGISIEEYEGCSCAERCHAKTVGMIANFRHQKDHETYLRAASLVLEQEPQARFLCVGSGINEERMKLLSRSLGIQDQVAFLGRREGAELIGIMSRLSVSVLASTNEGLPNALMESMALSIPVVSNPSGGVLELVEDGRTGYLFPYRRPDILAEKILLLLSHPELAREMGERGRQRIKGHFTKEIMIGHFETLYQNLCQTRGVLSDR
jgi:L-malate glycosyltransferase